MEMHSVLAIAKRSVAQIIHVTGIAEIVHTENHCSIEPRFSEIWLDALRLRSEYVSSLSSQFFHKTARPSSTISTTSTKTMPNRSAASQPEPAATTFVGDTVVSVDAAPKPPDRNNLDHRDGWGSANRDKHLLSYPVVKAVLSAVVDWVSKYRYKIGLYNQLGQYGSDEVMRGVANDLGVTLNQFREFASRGPGAADLLQKMLVAVHVDPKALADTDPHVMRDLQRVCITCSDKKRCKHEIANGKVAEHFWDFCPNTVTLDVLFVVSRPGPVANYRR
jgi:hypothetical protein